MGDGLKRARDAARATRGLPPETPKLAEIAERIAAHLRRFADDATINATRYYDDPRVTSNRSMVLVYYYEPRHKPGAGRYFDAKPSARMKKAQALGYLAWLDAGGVGRHWEWERQQASASKEGVK